MGERYPLCGCLTKTGAGCRNRASRVDACGVGFCHAHRNDSLCGRTEPVSSVADFDPGWTRDALAEEDGVTEVTDAR